jgi:hypothetical protein
MLSNLPHSQELGQSRVPDKGRHILSHNCFFCEKKEENTIQLKQCKNSNEKQIKKNKAKKNTENKIKPRQVRG